MKNLLFVLLCIALSSMVISCSEDKKLVDPEEIRDETPLVTSDDDSAYENNDETSDTQIGDDDSKITSDNENDIATDEDFESEPEKTEIVKTEYEAKGLIITNEELAPAFKKIAAIHTISGGIPTDVVTVESIYETQSGNDESEQIKNYVKERYNEGIKYLLLGGDIEIVPSRAVHDKFSNTFAGTYEEDFKSDFYYSDLSEWDTNGDGVYAADGEDDSSINGDTPTLIGDIPVSRFPASTADDVEIYYGKLLWYLTNYNFANVNKALFITNVATTLSFGIDVKIDAAHYFEAEGRTVDIFPETFTKKKLYPDTLYNPDSAGSETITVQKQIDAFSDGYNIMVHSGHGGVNYLTCEQTGSDNDFTGDQVAALSNTPLPLYISCACQAGQFEAPFGRYTKDSAGERLVTAVNGGAILYLGNATVGLGLAGGDQLIDETFKEIFKDETSAFEIFGDAFLVGHKNFPKTDKFAPDIQVIKPYIGDGISVVDENSWRWTQKSATLLGDLMIPVWKKELEPAPVVTIDVEKTDNGIKINSATVPENGNPLVLLIGNDYYEITATTMLPTEIETDATTLFAGFRSETSLYPFIEKVLE